MYLVGDVVAKHVVRDDEAVVLDRVVDHVEVVVRLPWYDQTTHVSY